MNKVYLTLFTCMLSSNLYAAQYNFKPGLWESTSKMEVSGVPEQYAPMFAKPPKVSKKCVTSEDANFNMEKEPQQQCTYNHNRVSADKMTFEVECNSKGSSMSGKGETNYHHTQVDGWFNMVVPQGPGGGPMTINTTYQSKYLGACK